MSPETVSLIGGKIKLVECVWLFSTVRFQMSHKTSCVWGCIVTLIAFVWIFSTVSFQMSPQASCQRTGKVTLAAFVCAFSNVSSNCLRVRIHSNIDCICLTFPHCVFSNVSSKRLHKTKQSHIGWICLTFLHCVVDQINNISKSDQLSLKDVGMSDHNFVIDQQRELLLSLRKVILMPLRITFLVEKSNSCVIENYWILYMSEKSKSRRNENCNQRELLSFFPFKDREK